MINLHIVYNSRKYDVFEEGPQYVSFNGSFVTTDAAETVLAWYAANYRVHHYNMFRDVGVRVK